VFVIVTHCHCALCRVVSTAMKCFHEIQSEIMLRCPVEGSAEYRRTYIIPLIDQTRHIVLDKCDMSPTYHHYFISSAERRHHHRTSATAVLVAATCSLVAFLRVVR